MIAIMYRHFNERNIDAAVSFMRDDVQWANGWKGGFVFGHDGVRNYWTAQWKEITPFVHPLSVSEKGNGQVEVLVHQIVHDKKGKLIVDGNVTHHFLFVSGLISKFEIENISEV